MNYKKEAVKQDLLKCYATAKLEKYLKTLGGAREATIATMYAIEKEEADFRKNAREQGEEIALALLEMHVEDAEISAKANNA
jgi:vacuolar-type H+-ATPase subunit D/Vma8